jgi:GT2 family glycosyltransferase
MRRRHFDAVGGFSEELESTDAGAFDLQLKIRNLGLRIIYQPASVVMYRRVGTDQGPPGQGV